MGAITLRLTDEMLAFVEGEAETNGYPDAEAFIQALVMDDHSRKIARLYALIQEGEASGFVDGDGFAAIGRAVAQARERYKSSGG